MKIKGVSAVLKLNKLTIIIIISTLIVVACISSPFQPPAPSPLPSLPHSTTSLEMPTTTSAPAVLTLPPPLPTPSPIWVATQTPASSELSGFVVYSDWIYPYTSSQIFLENLSTREIKQLTNVGSNGLPVWSPDGQQIAFGARRNGTNDIYIMNADGSNQTKLTICAGNNNGDPSWSPDGNEIVFAGDCEIIGKEAVYILNIKARRLTRLTEYGSYLKPSWSQNGEQIAYVVEQKGNGYIYIMDADGSYQEELVSTASRPIWCPDDSCIVYQAGYGQGYIGKLMVIDLKTKETKELLSPPYAAPEGITELLSARSPKRGLFTYSLGPIDPMLWAIDIKNNQVYSLGLPSYSGSLYP